MNNSSGNFIFYPSRINSNLKDIKECFSNELNSFTVAYSVKANYDSKLIQLLNENKVSFDCASIDELNILLKEKVKPQNIWLNTPYLEPKLLKKCINLGVFIYIDSLSDLELLQKKTFTENKIISVGIRISLPNYENSRFGIEANSQNILKLKKIFSASPFLRLSGVHIHYSSSDRSVKNFKNKIHQFFEIFDLHFKEFNIDSLNIGGGFASVMSQKLAEEFSYKVPNWEDYGKVFQKALKKFNIRGYKIIIEPGMAMVANGFDFVAEIIDIKKNNKNTYALVNTSILFIKPTRHNKNLDFIIEKNEVAKNTKKYTLVGISCMEQDVLGDYTGHLEIGDKIRFRNVGAYTLSYRKDFIFKQPLSITV